MSIAYCCVRVSAEEHQSSNGEVRNSFLAGVSQAVEFISTYISAVLGGWLGRLPVSQCSYIDIDPNIKSHTTIYKQIVRRSTLTTYEFKFHDPAHIITGIACAPQDDKTSSPEVEVVDGGISCHHVVIHLSPVQKGPWACSVEISGIEENTIYI